ncbi:uncharacterized protein LOC119193119, partial [Manduca sexta]|uniref:uncharacterized protein LOC119193119 n=1 Tax=Manduca sexta TaxID=7130 RepID=UPI00188F248A
SDRQTPNGKLRFLADLYGIVKNWDVLDSIGDHIYEIPGLCLKAVSLTQKDFQIVGLKTLLKVKDLLKSDLVLPFVEILVSFIQHSRDDDVLKLSIKTINVIARKYPEMIMDYVVRGKFDVNNLTEDKATLQKRARLLSNLASIDDFTKVILEEMLKMIVSNDEDACQVVEALSESILDKQLYPENKVVEIESDHGLIDKVINWLYTEQDLHNRVSEDGFILVNRLVANLPADKQKDVVDRHTQRAIAKCAECANYFYLIEALYGSLRQGVSGSYTKGIVRLSTTLALNVDDEKVRYSAASLLAQMLNKADFGEPFEVVYEMLNSKLEMEVGVSDRLLMLYAWVTKALVMRGSVMYTEWFQKITQFMNNPNHSKDVANAVKLIMSDSTHII